VLSRITPSVARGGGKDALAVGTGFVEQRRGMPARRATSSASSIARRDCGEPSTGTKIRSKMLMPRRYDVRVKRP